MNDFATYFLKKRQRKLLQIEGKLLQKINHQLNSLDIISTGYTLNFSDKKIPISKPFRYKLSDKLNNQSVKKFINDSKTDGVKNILISILWDENKV